MPRYINWSQIHSLKKLFVTTNTTAKESTIYGNGLNQTETIIHIIALDDSGNEITGIPTLDLTNNTDLIDYITGEPIFSKNGINDDNRWSFSFSSNGFNFPPPKNTSESDGITDLATTSIIQEGESNTFTPDISNNIDTNTDDYFQTNELMVEPLIGEIVSYYIMRGSRAASRSKQIAAKVRLTHPHAPIQTYSTGFNGTPGFDSYITVKALDPIDYSHDENRIVQETPMEIRSRSINYQLRSEETNGVVYTDHGGLTSRRSTIVISPAIGGTFHTVENLSDLEINDHYVNQGSMLWQESETPGFTGIKYEYPISVLGRVTGFSSSYFINYWYLNPQKAQFDGHCLLHNDVSYNMKYYRFFTNFNEDLIHEPHNPGRLVCWHFELGTYGLKNVLWRCVERENLRLRLTDRFGNQGVISLVFDLDKWFNKPHIV